MTISINKAETLTVTFKNSNKSVKISFKDGNLNGDSTQLREDCPSIVIETEDANIYLDTPNMSDLL